MIKINHSFKKGFRYYKQYRGVQLYYGQPDYWWNKDIKKWTLTPNWKENLISNTFYKCYSVKSFKRRLIEWSKYLPKGTKFILIGKYVGQDVIGTI